MQKKKMSEEEYNYHFRRASYDKESLDAIYNYSLDIIRSYINSAYGRNNYFSNVPHDVFTRLIFEYPFKKYINCHTSFLCGAARNYMNRLYKIKDNKTLELFDSYPYLPDYEHNIEFIDASAEKAWYELDELSRYILYLNICLDYKLNEIAEILNLRHTYVRTKKSRAVKALKAALKIKEVNK